MECSGGMIVRRVSAVGVIVLVLSLGLAAPGESQSGQPDFTVQFKTTLQAVDCDGQQLTLAGPGASTVVQSTLGTVIHVDGAVTPFCSLSPLVGAPATAWVIARGGQIVLVQLDVVSGAAPVPAPPVQPDPGAPSPVPAAPSPADPPAYNSAPSGAAVVLGTVIVGGLLYLILQSADGAYYRYPYSGPYGDPRPAYRPYAGPYIGVPGYTYGPYRRCHDGTYSHWCR